MTRWRQRAWRIVNPAQEGDRASLLFDVLIISLIVVDVIWFISSTTLDTYEAFKGIDGPILLAFTAEYLLRLWTCKEDRRYAKRFGRLVYSVTPLAIIDLVAILPMLSLLDQVLDTTAFWFFPSQLTSIRVFRLFRLAKLFRYFDSVAILPRTVWRIRNELGALAVGLLMAVLTASLLMHALEREDNPDHFGTIPEAMWWSVVTMTTVGYGDVIPITIPGRVVASFLMVAGMAMFAIPAGLLGAAFTREVTVAVERKRAIRDRRLLRAEELLEERIEAVLEASRPDLCPHCGKELPHPRAREPDGASFRDD